MVEYQELYKKVHKNNNQLPNIEELMDTKEQTISERKSAIVYFTTMDLTYAYSQLLLSKVIHSHCKFFMVGKNSWAFPDLKQVFCPPNNTRRIPKGNGFYPEHFF